MARGITTRLPMIGKDSQSGGLIVQDWKQVNPVASLKRLAELKGVDAKARKGEVSEANVRHSLPELREGDAAKIKAAGV